MVTMIINKAANMHIRFVVAIVVGVAGVGVSVVPIRLFVSLRN